MTTSLHTLIQTLDDWMQADSFQDYAPNGVQVEGRDEIHKLALGVTASADVIEQAVGWGADALLVHHGYFWKNESATLTGIKGRRIRALLENQMSLIAYHLPLDCHPEFGNNKTLLDQLDLPDGSPIDGEGGLLWSVALDGQLTLDQLADRIASCLNRTPTVIQSPRAKVRLERMIICTGGAQDYITKAQRYGADIYLSGEILSAQRMKRASLECTILRPAIMQQNGMACRRWALKSVKRWGSRRLFSTTITPLNY